MLPDIDKEAQDEAKIIAGSLQSLDDTKFALSTINFAFKRYSEAGPLYNFIKSELVGKLEGRNWFVCIGSEDFVRKRMQDIDRIELMLVKI